MEYDKLPKNVRKNLLDRFDDNEENLRDAVALMSPFEVFDMWCDYVGFIFWGSEIWETCKDLQKEDK